MSDLSIDLHWQRAEPMFQSGKYSAEHTVRYNSAVEVLVDEAPDWGGKAENTNPEQALAAALSSCHMMTFLALSASRDRQITGTFGTETISVSRARVEEFDCP